jgi:hypothetical protein
MHALAVAILLASAPVRAQDPEESDPDAVARKIRNEYFKTVVGCYHDALRRDSDLKGRVELSLVLQKDGKVKEARVSGFDTKMDECLTAEAKKWRFAKAAAEQTYDLPFSIKPPAPVDATPEVEAKVAALLEAGYLPQMEKCLPKAKKKKKVKPKTVQVAFTLRMDGTAREVTAKGLDKKGNKCVVAAAKDWRLVEATGTSFYQVETSVELGKPPPEAPKDDPKKPR